MRVVFIYYKGPDKVGSYDPVLVTLFIFSVLQLDLHYLSTCFGDFIFSFLHPIAVTF